MGRAGPHLLSGAAVDRSDRAQLCSRTVVRAGERSGLARRALGTVALVALIGFVVLRMANAYGEPLPWEASDEVLGTVMSSLNLTKYPPPASFLLLTLGLGGMVADGFERLPAQLVNSRRFTRSEAALSQTKSTHRGWRR